MSSLKVAVGTGKVTLSGFLDENSDLKAMETLTGSVGVNFKEVARVNSCGVREWVNLINKVPKAQMVYEECPIVVVKQLNAVPDFQGKAQISSFYAPYFCEECDAEAIKLLSTNQIVNGVAPEMKCDTCKKTMNFDAIPNQYFSFLKRGGTAAKAA